VDAQYLPSFTALLVCLQRVRVPYFEDGLLEWCGYRSPDRLSLGELLSWAYERRLVEMHLFSRTHDGQEFPKVLFELKGISREFVMERLVPRSHAIMHEIAALRNHPQDEEGVGMRGKIRPRDVKARKSVFESQKKEVLSVYGERGQIFTAKSVSALPAFEGNAKLSGEWLVTSVGKGFIEPVPGMQGTYRLAGNGPSKPNGTLQTAASAASRLAKKEAAPVAPPPPAPTAPSAPPPPPAPADPSPPPPVQEPSPTKPPPMCPASGIPYAELALSRVVQTLILKIIFDDRQWKMMETGRLCRRLARQPGWAEASSQGVGRMVGAIVHKTDFLNAYGSGIRKSYSVTPKGMMELMGFTAEQCVEYQTWNPQPLAQPVPVPVVPTAVAVAFPSPPVPPPAPVAPPATEVPPPTPAAPLPPPSPAAPPPSPPKVVKENDSELLALRQYVSELEVIALRPLVETLCIKMRDIEGFLSQYSPVLRERITQMALEAMKNKTDS